MGCCICDCERGCCACDCERRPATEVINGLQTRVQKVVALVGAGYNRSEVLQRLAISEKFVQRAMVQGGYTETQLNRHSRCVCACERLPKEKVTDGLRSKADKIRALHSAGYSRTTIAEYLGIRPQHARNVLVDGGVTEVQLVCVCPDETLQESVESLPELVRTAIGPGGRVVIPAAYRRALEVNEGDYIIMRMDGEELRVINDAKELQRMREVLNRYVPEGVSLVDELIADRRREAAAEEAEVAAIKARQARAANTASE